MTILHDGTDPYLLTGLRRMLSVASAPDLAWQLQRQDRQASV